MEQVSIIGIDTSKRSFQLHGSTAEGCPVFRKTLSRGKLLSFLARQPPCEIVMEACGGSHYWGREIITLGHVCKLIPPIYVKPFLKRQKNDANDSEAIVEAAQRPTMRFVAVRTEEAQAGSMFNEKIAGLDRDIRARAREQEEIKRLMTIPGVGPICAMAVNAFAPPMESFRRGRDFAAWIGLTPRQNSTAGKQRLGRITKMGQRDLRRLLILGATAVVRQMRRRKEVSDPWLRRLIAEKPPKLVAVALANKMARTIWALSIKKETYRAPVAVGVAG